MTSKQQSCMYCGQLVRLVYEQGRPQAMQNGRPHVCSFSKLGLTSGERILMREDKKAREELTGAGRRTTKWSLWGALFGKG